MWRSSPAEFASRCGRIPLLKLSRGMMKTEEVGVLPFRPLRPDHPPLSRRVPHSLHKAQNVGRPKFFSISSLRQSGDWRSRDCS